MFITFAGLSETTDGFKASLIERDFKPSSWLIWLADLLNPPARYLKDERQILGLLRGLDPNHQDPGTRATVANLRRAYDHVSIDKFSRGVPYATNMAGAAVLRDQYVGGEY